MLYLHRCRIYYKKKQVVMKLHRMEKCILSKENKILVSADIYYQLCPYVRCYSWVRDILSARGEMSPGVVYAEPTKIRLSYHTLSYMFVNGPNDVPRCAPSQSHSLHCGVLAITSFCVSGQHRYGSTEPMIWSQSPIVIVLDDSYAVHTAHTSNDLYSRYYVLF